MSEQDKSKLLGLRDGHVVRISCWQKSRSRCRWRVETCYFINVQFMPLVVFVAVDASGDVLMCQSENCIPGARGISDKSNENQGVLTTRDHCLLVLIHLLVDNSIPQH
jgi:hypothetical protein